MADFEPPPAVEGKKYDLGVVILDYAYPPALGDVDDPNTYAYNTLYVKVKGLTFPLCQIGKPLEEPVKSNFINAIKYLEEHGVKGITGDCGFMLNYQAFARTLTHLPVFVSSLCQLPALSCCYSKNESIAIFTANGRNLEKMRDLIQKEIGVDPKEAGFTIVGCEGVDGFEAVADGTQVDVEKVKPGIVDLAIKTIEEAEADDNDGDKNKNIQAFLFECTELGPYSNAVREATGLPVYDAITTCNSFMSGHQTMKFSKADNA
jgi:hypothetical protein